MGYGKGGVESGRLLVRDDPKLLDDKLVVRYPNLKDEVGGSIPSCEIDSLLDINLRGGQVLPCV